MVRLGTASLALLGNLGATMLALSVKLAAASLAIAAAGCTEALPPFGEVILSVDTDLEVPAQVGRLRIDLYSEDGTWYASRDELFGRRDDWPVSFSVYSEDEEHKSIVYARLRAYPEGAIRDYRGERFADGSDFVEPPIVATPEDLCVDPPVIALGTSITRRRDRFPISALQEKAECYLLPNGFYFYDNEAGSVSASVDITEAGDYRLGVVSATPLGIDTALAPHVSIEVRKTCADETTNIACHQGIEWVDLGGAVPAAVPVPAQVEVHLTPGRYTMVTGSPVTYEGPSDITLAAAPADTWNPEDYLPQPQPEPPSLPQLDPAAGPTPDHEPEPGMTVDRLVRIEIDPGVQQTAHVVLRGACLGVMARLSATPPHQALVPGEAESCVAEEGVRLAVTAEALKPAPAPPPTSVAGTFRPEQPCDPAPPGDRVCVPGGATILGEQPEASGLAGSSPPRAMVIRRFFMDRFEVSVGQFRQAIAENMPLKFGDRPRANDGPLDFGPGSTSLERCTYSKAPLPGASSRESYPVNCLSWYAARTYCQFRGGDLPTEAQWEYAARWAGKASPSRFPWGDDDPRCSCEGVPEPCHTPVFARAYKKAPVGGEGFYACALDASGKFDSSKVGPQPIGGPIGPSTDATPLGIVDLGGSLSEWLLDSFHDYGSPCWRGAKLTDPRCWEENAPARSRRGGGWNVQIGLMLVTMRSIQPPGGRPETVGFRCVYPGAP